MAGSPTPFGAVGDDTIRLHRLRSGPLRAAVTDFGARLVALEVPGADGVVADVVLGCADAAAYAASDAYLGAVVGRHANRIRGARFVLDGHELALDANDPPHHLHGGREGWDRRRWTAEPGGDGAVLVLRLTDPAGTMGYPGTVSAEVRYELRPAALRVTITATTDRPTIVGAVHHPYLNLAGHDAGPVLDHELAIAADHRVEVDDELLPTGAILAVAGSPWDFRRATPVGLRMGEPGPSGPAARGPAGGWDDAWCLRDPLDPDGLREAAVLVDPASRRRLRVRTDAPALHVYAAGMLADAVPGKHGRPYGRHAGIALEAEGLPDAPHHPHFPTAVLRPGATFRRTVEYAFEVA